MVQGRDDVVWFRVKQTWPDFRAFKHNSAHVLNWVWQEGRGECWAVLGYGAVKYLNLLKYRVLIPWQIWKLSSSHRTGRGQFSFQSQRRQCQRMFKLLLNCTPLTCQQGNAQNFPSQASTICEMRIYRCSIWIQKRQRSQRSNCQHPLDYRKSKRVSKKKKHLPLLY